MIFFAILQESDPQIPTVFIQQGVWLKWSKCVTPRLSSLQRAGGSAMMKARHDVPLYLSWVFPLQTSLHCGKDRSRAPFQSLSSSSLSFLCLDSLSSLLCFDQEVSQMCSAKQLQRWQAGRSNRWHLHCFLTSRLQYFPFLLSKTNEVSFLLLYRLSANAYLLLNPLSMHMKGVQSMCAAAI